MVLFFEQWSEWNKIKYYQYEYGNQTFSKIAQKIDEYPILGYKDDMRRAFSKNLVYSDDIYKVNFEVMYLFYESCLYQSLEDFILKLHQHGLIDYLKKKYFDALILPEKFIEDDRKVLTLYVLSAGFCMWLIMIIISILAFIGEHIVRFVTRQRSSNDGTTVIYDLQYDYEFEWC